MILFLIRNKMDTIKIILIGVLIALSYYLLLQWPPTSSTNDNEVTSTSTPTDQDVTLINEDDDELTLYTEPYTDSKDLLTGLEERPNVQTIDEGMDLLASNSLNVFYVNNNVLKIGIDSVTGRFISSELKTIKTSKGSDASLSILGNRVLDADLAVNKIDKEGGCRVNEGAVVRSNSSPERISYCLGNYYASSGYFSDTKGYLNPNFNFIDKASMAGGKSLYVLSGENGEFSFVRKIVISPDEYSVSVEDIVGLKQGSFANEKLIPYIEIVRDGLDTGLDESRFASYSYMGPVFSTENDSFQKVSFSDLSDKGFQEVSENGWFALIQRYFMTSWIPSKGEAYKYQARKTSSNNYSLALTGAASVVSEQSPVSFKNTFYVGPKISEDLNKLDPDLGLVVDYGFLWWLGQPMYWLLGVGFGLLANWGFAIIFATLVIRGVLWPLTAASYRSMAKMRAVAPKMQALQTKYANDKAKLAQETMAFYKKEGVNPLGGCLPMILQMPFFIAFYWVLLDTVQLRHAPFVFWIDDLSARDPYFFLPIVNGLLMFLSQKFMPVTPSNDPTQQQMQQMMKYMPVGICVIFAWFPSGFVLYFVAQTLVQLIQQTLNFRKEGVTLRSVIFK